MFEYCLPGKMSMKASWLLGMNGVEKTVAIERGLVALEVRNSYVTNSSIEKEKDRENAHPQPTTDPLDPLNWTMFKKHTILAIVMGL